MIDLDVFLPSVMPSVPGCPIPSAERALVTAAREFCQRTRLWRDEDTFTITPNNCNVVCTPSNADLFEIEYALLDGLPLEAISLADLDRKVPQWRDLENGGKWITQIEHDTVLVVPKCSGALKLCTILVPTEDADQMPDFLAKHYRQVIADGALAEILMLPGQPFTDPTRAQFFSMRFESRLSGLSGQSIKGQQRAPLRSTPQFM